MRRLTALESQAISTQLPRECHENSSSRSHLHLPIRHGQTGIARTGRDVRTCPYGPARTALPVQPCLYGPARTDLSVRPCMPIVPCPYGPARKLPRWPSVPAGMGINRKTLVLCGWAIHEEFLLHALNGESASEYHDAAYHA